jgi:hypothetical protein
VNLGDQETTAFGVTVPAGGMSVIAGDGFKWEGGAGRFTGDGGPATAASLNFPRGPIFDDEGDLLFNDIDNARVRKVDRQTGSSQPSRATDRWSSSDPEPPPIYGR